MRRALAAAALTLLLPPAASAHITISPPFVEDGIETGIAFQTPNERPPHGTTALSVTAPPGIAVVSAAAPPGWSATVNGSTVTWTGDRIEDRAAVTFPMRVRAQVRAGTYAFGAVQAYDDGATVRWKAQLSVLPATGAAAPKQHPWGAVAAALAGVVVIGGSLLLVRHLRRRSLQDR